MAKKKSKMIDTSLRDLGDMAKVDLEFLIQQLKERCLELEHQAMILKYDPLVADLKLKERRRIQTMIIRFDERMRQC